MEGTADPGLYNAQIYPCKSCGPFLLINLKEMTTQVLETLPKYPMVVPPTDPETFNLLRNVLARPIAHALSNFKPKLRSAAMIKDTIPQFSPHLGGCAFGRNGRADIPLYKCMECRALFVLPSEVRDAGRKVDPVKEASLTEGYMRDIAVGAMKNAYRSLELLKAAQVYCFKDFVVMVDFTTHPGRGRSFFCLRVVVANLVGRRKDGKGEGLTRQ